MFLCLWSFPGENTGVGCHFLLLRDLPDPGMKPTAPTSAALAGGFFTTSATWGHPLYIITCTINITLFHIIAWMIKSHFQVFKKSHSFNYLPMVGYLDFTIIDSWCWEGLGAGGEGDDRRWDGWMASLTRWTWVWVDSGSWWWTGRPGVLWFMGSQRVGHDWATELNWTGKCMCV